MATIVQEPGESSGSKRRRRRARQEARVAIENGQNGQNGQDGPNGHDGHGGAAHDAEPSAVALIEPVVAVVEAPPPPVQSTPAVQVDEYRDVLGQAVGLRLDAVSREFGGRHEMHVTALQNVTIDIGPGEFVAIVGPSGCGKSTLLSLMGGLDRPTSGHVYAAGLPLGELPDREISDYRLQRVSTIFQTFNLIASMTVEDNVALQPRLGGRRGRAQAPPGPQPPWGDGGAGHARPRGGAACPPRRAHDRRPGGRAGRGQADRAQPGAGGPGAADALA